MKAINKLAVLFSLAALSSVAFAKSEEQAYLETCRKDPGVPVPVAVVTPTVGVEYAGTTVQLEFIVDKAGKPADVTVTSDTDYALSAVVAEAVKQWRFKPAEANGVAVATKVSLPVRIIDNSLVASSQ